VYLRKPSILALAIIVTTILGMATGLGSLNAAAAAPPLQQQTVQSTSSPASPASSSVASKPATSHAVSAHRTAVSRRVIHKRIYRRRVVHHPARRTRYAARRRTAYSSGRRVASVRRKVVHHYVRRRLVYRRTPIRRAAYHSVVRPRYHYVRAWSPWDVASINRDPAFGDDPNGQNPYIRAAAIKALGDLNGSVVVVDPNDGRILAFVNQELALTRGYIPCSTVKPMVALAGLKEGVVTLRTRLIGMWGRPIDMTVALAHSDNRYFADVGNMLGFERVERYAQLLGYGQRAALDIPDESPGVFPSAPPPASIGGVGRLTSFGTGIDQTPLQVAALVSAIANGGTLYWLQWPRTPEEIANFQPKVRASLTGLAPYIPEVREGMAASVLYGTSRMAYNPFENVFGKTGTCSEDGGRMGWFVSFSEQRHPRYVVVVMLRGGRPMFGPHAAEIGGVLYRSLLPQNMNAAEASAAFPELLHPPRGAGR
jgi:penicillin-binding protein 2